MASSKEDRKVRRQEWRVGLHDEELLRMLHLLRFSRYFDERLEALYRQGRLPGAFYSGRGQEGTHVGVAFALQAADSLFPTHRDLTAQFTKGLDALKAKRMMGTSGKNLVDPSHALDHFYEALLKGEGTRIIHYGDSPTTADLITADARAMLQREFGGGGSGFVLVARPWAWYNHRGVSMEASNWKIDIAGNAELKDGLYGLGAVSFRGQPGAIAHWNLRDSSHTSVEVYYLNEPDGGEFVLEAEDKPLGTVNTTAEQQAPAFAHFDIPPGATHFTLKVTSGNVRAYGADFRKDGPGAGHQDGVGGSREGKG